MNEDHKESGFLRGFIGLIALGGAMAGFFALFFVEIPGRNENALLLALGVVLGWAGAVVGSEYGSSTTGRKVAESAIRKIERTDVAANEPPPADAVEAAQDTATAAQDKADIIKGKTNG